ncbi:uncharacterized protein BDZ99DRAFT_457552 [Mytilinidion resinicola]|uniref:NAD(P)-binding protein n=1 Tax=Mytilinidion resinicola TaxID=574789 RepID=A0A6A6ZAE0_9PEZI|nr:uncharacterized protein BDZ99DRAFT_457552 [Mytilinidion resinicola]KAF2817986.1 hypothetical protein BDZ99DRAFT_457552 [Mytilinidion resinicola]
MLRPSPSCPVDLLILGAGWTSTFLLPLLSSAHVSYAATTTSGHDDTIPFRFDPDSSDKAPYERLPKAKVVLVTFPLVGTGQSKHLVGLYESIHGKEAKWIQLGATSIWNEKSARAGEGGWADENSPYDTTNNRAVAEDELRGLGGVVLNLAGLYGGERVPARWLGRVVKTKEEVRVKGCVHFIHGADVARAILAVTERLAEGGPKWIEGRRFIIADLHVYDWWDLTMAWGGKKDDKTNADEETPPYCEWVGELMVETGVKALPRAPELLGRKLDSRRFWSEMGVWPREGRLA